MPNAHPNDISEDRMKLQKRFIGVELWRDMEDTLWLWLLWMFSLAREKNGTEWIATHKKNQL